MSKKRQKIFTNILGKTMCYVSILRDEIINEEMKPNCEFEKKMMEYIYESVDLIKEKLKGEKV